MRSKTLETSYSTPPMIRKKKETPVKKQVKAWLDERGILNWPASAGPYSVSGLSDRMALHDGIFYAIEVKRPGEKGKAKPLQLRFINNVIKAGGRGAVVDCVEDLEELFNASPTPTESVSSKATQPRESDEPDRGSPSIRVERRTRHARTASP